MSDLSPWDLRALVDHMAARGVAELSATQSDVEIRITLRATPTPPAVMPIRAPLRAGGPGIFRPRHPVGDTSLPCLQAGDFLFPLAATLDAADEILASHGAEVGYGTPLWLRAAQGDSA